MVAHTHMRKVEFSCHYCGLRLIRRTSWLAHGFLRQTFYQCNDPGCGACFIGTNELTHLATPGRTHDTNPCPLPISPNHLHVMARRVLEMNLGTRQMDLLEEQEEAAHE